MVVNQPPLKKGYNMLTEENGAYKNMMMDVGVYLMEKGDEQEFLDNSKETAFLLLTGEIVCIWNEKSVKAQRKSLFEEKPYCLHVPCGVSVKIKANEKTEVLIQKATNPKEFQPVLYTPENLVERILGENVVKDAARRVIRDIFVYENAPYSMMVLGEIINLAGKWSSYPPHEHRQPEIYYYKFDKPQGFGFSMVGDNVYKISDGSFAAIPGNVMHPQVAAPGYPMYYTWMIRHFENDPWTERNFEHCHMWLLDTNAEIWSPKK